MLHFLAWMVIALLALDALAGAGLGLLDQPESLKGIHVALAAAVWTVLVLMYQESRGVPGFVAQHDTGTGRNRQLRQAR